VATNTASYWAKNLLSEFVDICENPPHRSTLPKLSLAEVLYSYERSKKRLIVVDYDGTLTQIQSLPQLATPSTFTINLLDTLSRDPKNTVLVVSGRERRFMQKWLGHLNVGLAAEYGFYHRMPGSTQWESIGSEIDTTWKSVVQPIMRCVGARRVLVVLVVLLRWLLVLLRLLLYEYYAWGEACAGAGAGGGAAAALRVLRLTSLLLPGTSPSAPPARTSRTASRRWRGTTATPTRTLGRGSPRTCRSTWKTC